MSYIKRKIEVFTAGCPACQPSVDAILVAACEHCEVEVHDLSASDRALVALAASYGVRRLPAVVIDGQVASCCALPDPDLDTLRTEGLGAGA